MVNSQMITEVSDAFKLDLRVDKIPSVIPVSESNPRIVKCGITTCQSTTVTGAGTLLAAQPNVDIIIKSIQFTYTKNAACDATTIPQITVTYAGQTKTIISLALITLTADTMETSMEFPNGLKIDRGTSVNFNNVAFAAGSMVRTACINYVVDDII